MLRQVVDKGLSDISRLPKDPDLDTLRQGADNADLLWDLADSPAPAKSQAPK